MSQPEIVARIEGFVRSNFSVSETDPHFGPEADLFEGGYVDSVGLAEVLGFIEDEFGVAVPDEELLADEFATIAGMSRTVRRLSGDAEEAA
jgi:acyl carrier protein